MYGYDLLLILKTAYSNHVFELYYSYICFTYFSEPWMIKLNTATYSKFYHNEKTGEKSNRCPKTGCVPDFK